MPFPNRPQPLFCYLSNSETSPKITHLALNLESKLCTHLATHLHWRPLLCWEALTTPQEPRQGSQP